VGVGNGREKHAAGQGRSQPMKGDAFPFFPNEWRFGIVASLLSRTGKHTPLL